MFAIYLYHKEEGRKENRVRSMRGQQCRVTVFHQAALAQACIIPSTLIRLPWFSLCV